MLIRIRPEDEHRVVKRTGPGELQTSAISTLHQGLAPHLGCRRRSTSSRPTASVPVPPVAVRRPAIFARPDLRPCGTRVGQLPVTIDKDGYLVANGDFIDPSDRPSGNGIQCHEPKTCRDGSRTGDADRLALPPLGCGCVDSQQVFATHWSFLLGRDRAHSFIVLLLTGSTLHAVFDPSMAEVTYHGRYQPSTACRCRAPTKPRRHQLRGPAAACSLRQIHHWAALLFAASIMVHCPHLLHRSVPQATRGQLV